MELAFLWLTAALWSLLLLAWGYSWIGSPPGPLFATPSQRLDILWCLSAAAVLALLGWLFYSASIDNNTFLHLSQQGPTARYEVKKT